MSNNNNNNSYKSITENSRFLNDVALKAEADRSEAARVLGSFCNITGKLRRAMWFLLGTRLPVARSQKKHPLIRLEQQLRGRSARQLIQMRRRELGELMIEQRRAHKNRDAILAGTCSSSAPVLGYLESRMRAIVIEMRRRGLFTEE